MKQSELLMQGVEFSPFLVDYSGFKLYKERLVSQHQDQQLKLAQFGLVKYNSAKETKAWLEQLGCDCSRGSGKEVYLNPTNMTAHPEELGCLAEMKRLEALRRKFVSVEALFEQL